MHTSLILYAEHEFNASTFTAASSPAPAPTCTRRSPAPSARCADPSTAAPTRSRSTIQQRYETPDEAEADIRARIAAKEVIIGFGHPVYTIADPRNKVIKAVARQARRQRGRTSRCSQIAERIESVMCGRQEDVPQPRLVLAPSAYHMMGVPTRDVHAAVRHLAHSGWAAHIIEQRTTARSSARRPTTPGRTIARSCPSPIVSSPSSFDAIAPESTANVRSCLQRPPQARPGPGRHRRLRRRSTRSTSEDAYDTARYCLIDTLGCGFEALELSRPAPSCSGPIVPGTIVPNGARVPGTPFQLDPVQAAFNIGAMIRWLDFNDTWLAAEWGHPSDNLGGILAVADWLSRNAIAAGKAPLTDARRADRDDQGARDPGRARAREQLQPRRPRPRRAGEGRLDRGGRAACSASRATRSSTRCRTPGSTARPAHLPPRAQHRLAQELGRRRRHRRAPCASRSSRRPARWATRRCSRAKTWGFYDVLFKGKRVQVPAPLRQLRDGERAVQDLASRPSSTRRPRSKCAMTAATRRWQGPARRHREDHDPHARGRRSASSTRRARSHNPADRDHCIQYMVAVPLIFGRLTAADYEDDVAADPRIDALRDKIACVEDKQFTQGLPRPRQALDRQRAHGRVQGRHEARRKSSSSTRSATSAAARKACRCWSRSSAPTSRAASRRSSSRRSSTLRSTRSASKRRRCNEFVDLMVHLMREVAR